MKCKLPFKTAFQNSKAFLQDMDIIGEDYKILNDMEFDKVTFELEKDNIQTYKVSGRPWIRDIVRGGAYAEPNLEVLERIDQKRKELGLYEDQLSAEIPLISKENKPDFITPTIIADTLNTYKQELSKIISKETVETTPEVSSYLYSLLSPLFKEELSTQNVTESNFIDFLNKNINDENGKSLYNRIIDFLKRLFLKEKSTSLLKEMRNKRPSSVFSETGQMVIYGITSNQQSKIPLINQLLYRSITPANYNKSRVIKKAAISLFVGKSYDDFISTIKKWRDEDVKNNSNIENVTIPKWATEISEESYNKREDAWRLSNGLPQKHNSFKYIGRGFLDKNYDLVLDEKGEDVYGFVNPSFLASEEEFKKGIDKTNAVMGRFAVKFGQDETGHYLQYNDRWDLDISKGIVGKVIEVTQNPFIVSGKIYKAVTFDETGNEVLYYTYDSTNSDINNYNNLLEELNLQESINEPDTTILKDQGFFDIDRNIKLDFDFTNKSYIPSEKVESLEEMANRIGVLQRKEREYLLTKQKLNDSGVSKPVSSRITIGEFAKPTKDFKGIQSSHIGKYVWNGTNYRFESIKGSESTSGSKFVSQVFDALLDKNRSQQLLDRGLENAWLQRKESPESFMAALALSIGNRMSAKYKRFEFVSYRVSEHPGAGMFFYNPNDKTIDFNLHYSFAWLTNYERLEDLVNNLESTLDEEIIHSIADKILTKEDVSNIYNELTAFEKQKIKQYYLGRNDNKGDLSEHQLVHEYLRVVTQQELFNQTTEDTYRIRLVQSAIDFFKRLLNEIVNLFKTRTDNPFAKRAVGNIKSILSSEEFYQIQSKTDEITPALKNTLEQFVRKLNPDFKIEVLADLLDRRGVNGIAKISEFVIQLQRGKEGALPEEVAHFLIELLDNEHPLKKTMRDEITRTRLYKNLRQHPGYKKVFGNDLDGFKREAMAKLVALYLTDKESFKYQVGSDSVYENIVRWIKDFFRWIKGQSNAIGSFIEAADKIVNLDTSGLLLQQGRYVEEMYSMGDFITSATTLTTVSNLNTKYYDRVLINLSDTVFDTNGFFGADKTRKRKVLFAGDDPELIDFYNNVELTSLGRELQDKMSNGAIENITFYTSMSHHPALEQRLQSLFGLNVDIRYIDKTKLIEDENGNIIKESQTDSLADTIREYGIMKIVLIDNQPINVGFDVDSRLYRESKSTIYESFIETLRNRDRKEAEQNRMKSFLDELSTLSQESVTLKIKEGFSIIRSNFGEIGKLEETLSKEEIDDAYDSLFREEGALLLPIAQAKKGKKLLEKIDQYENAVLTFFGTLEAVTNFFKDRNEADYEQIKKRLDEGSEKEIDMAIKELALVNKMGQKWEGFIKDMTALIAGVPKTEAVSKVLGNLSQQISTSRIKSRNLAVHVIGAKLTPLLASYNANRLNEMNTMLSRLDKVSEAEKPEIQKTINRLKKDQNEDGSFLNADDIIDILNGEGKDMAPLTVWLKPLHNSSDLIVGPLVKLLRQSQAEVEVSEIVRAQQLGSFIRGEEKRVGITEKDWNDRIIFLDDIYVFENVDGKLTKVKKPAMTLLHAFKNEYRRDEEYAKVAEKKEKWTVSKNSGKPDESLLKEFIDERNKFQQWLNIHWHQEYSQAYYERYKEIETPENEILFEKIKEEQGELYDKIEELSIRSENEEGVTKRDTNREIEQLRAEIKGMRRETYFDGTPKVGVDLDKAKLLQRKLEIDREFFEYKSDIPTFRRDFLVFLKSQNVDPEVFANIELKLREDNLTGLYKYVRKNNLKNTLEWLDDNTVLRYHQDWYEKRKVLSEEISEISEQISNLTGNPHKSTLTDLWGELFNLTSYLRDEDNIFDGSSASPQIQAKVKEYEVEIERIKRLTRELPKVTSPELKALKKKLKEKVEILSSLQHKRITETYKDTFNLMISQTGFQEIFNANGKNIYAEGINLIDFINSPEFKQSIKDNPEHDFVKWYNDNHVTRMYYEDNVETEGTSPTYIWLQIEPTNKDYVLTVPSFKYSKRTVQEKHHTVKEEKTYNHSIRKWNPKSAEFMNPEYKKLMESTNPKERSIFNILKKIEEYHLSTQFDTRVTEGNLGYTLPYIKKQIYEEGYIKNIKREFFDQTNRFEEGEGNFQETGKKSSLSKTKDRIVNWWKNADTEIEEEDKTELQKIMRVAVPYTKYQEPDAVSKDVLMSVVRFSASTRSADKMLDNLPFINLIEDTLVNTPKVDKLGRPINVQKERIASLQFAKESLVFGINNQYELGQGIENAARTIRKVNTYGSLAFNVANVVKNNLQGRLQNLIGSTFGDWSTNKSMAKAARNFKTNYAWFLSQGEKPLDKRDIHFHILSYFNPEMDSNIYDNLNKGSVKRNVASSNLMMFNKAMEFSIVSNMIFARLYHVKVRGEKGDVKELFDVLEAKNGKLTVKPGYVEVKTGREINDEYLLDTKLAYSTVVEYVQGRVSAKTKLSTTTIGQALLYFKNWLTPMIRRRFDNKEKNYMIGEDLEGYWRVFLKMSVNMFRDILTVHRLNWHSYTPSQQRDFNTTLKEIGVMMATLGILGLGFGFDADDPDKFKKLKNNSAYKNYALLLLLQAKNETEALSLMPFVNTETSLIPPIATEGAKFLTNPTIGLAMIDNSLKTMNLLGELVSGFVTGDDSAYYDRNMPQFGIEKGDIKAVRYATKVIQLDDFILLDDPEQKLRTVIGNMKR